MLNDNRSFKASLIENQNQYDTNRQDDEEILDDLNGFDEEGNELYDTYEKRDRHS